MNKKPWITFILIFFGFLIFLGVLYLRLTSVRSDAADNSDVISIKPVKTIDIISTESWINKEVLGRVQGGQAVNIRTNVSGWVKTIHFIMGQNIRKDEIIITLYDNRTEIKLLEAKYNLESTMASLQETQRIYEKNKVLLNKGIIAKDEVDSTYNKLESDKAKVRALEAIYKRVKWDYDNLKIKSPINGKVVKVEPDVGQEVLNGEIVARVVNLDEKKIIAGVDVTVARLIKTDMEVKLSTNTNGESEFATGKVVGVSQNFDDISNTYEVEINILDKNVNWWPGEIVLVNVPTRKLDNVTLIPRTAVLSDADQFFVFVAKDGISMKIPVEVVWVDDKNGFIPVDKFPKNSQIIIEGNAGLKSGQKVNVIN